MTRDVQPVLDLLGRLPVAADPAADSVSAPSGTELAELLRLLSANGFDLRASIEEIPHVN